MGLLKPHPASSRMPFLHLVPTDIDMTQNVAPKCLFYNVVTDQQSYQNLIIKQTQIFEFTALLEIFLASCCRQLVVTEAKLGPFQQDDQGSNQEQENSHHPHLQLTSVDSAGAAAAGD